MLEPNADWSEVVDDGGEVPRDGGEVSRDGSEVARDSGEASDVEISSNESSDEFNGLVTISERRSESDRDVPRISALYNLAIKKSLPAEEDPEKMSYHPSYLSEFEKEHFNTENVMLDRPYTAFFSAPS